MNRDRDSSGRPRSARPRDALGRPLQHEEHESHASSELSDSADAAELAELEAADFPTLLAGAQRLLDQGRPFQAHEVLEAAWKRAPEPERPLWRALAQLAVGITHILRGNQPGAQAVLTRSAGELESWAPESAPYGIDSTGLAAAAQRMASTGRVEPVGLTH